MVKLVTILRMFRIMRRRSVNCVKYKFMILFTGTKRRTRNCYCGPDFDEPETDLPKPGCEGPSVDEQPCDNGPCGKMNFHAN